jgi:hypothetical protein
MGPQHERPARRSEPPARQPEEQADHAGEEDWDSRLTAEAHDRAQSFCSWTDSVQDLVSDK